MIQAVLPRRRQAVDLRGGERVFGNVWVASRAAVGGGRDGWRAPPQRRVPAQAGYRLRQRHIGAQKVDGEWVTDRVALLTRALQVKAWRQQTEPLPAALAAAVDRELQSLWDQAMGGRPEDEWLHWRFEWPEYQSQPGMGNAGIYVPQGWSGMGWSLPVVAAGGGSGGPAPAPPAGAAPGGQAGVVSPGLGGQGNQGGRGGFMQWGTRRGGLGRGRGGPIWSLPLRRRGGPPGGGQPGPGGTRGGAGGGGPPDAHARVAQAVDSQPEEKTEPKPKKKRSRWGETPTEAAASKKPGNLPPPTTYVSVSEVGDMVSTDPSGGPNWALLPDNGGGYDVFDIRCESSSVSSPGRLLTDHDVNF